MSLLPLQEKETLKFAVADNKGHYKFELERTVKYEITVLYIGFVEEVFVVEPNSNVLSYDFTLKPIDY